MAGFARRPLMCAALGAAVWVLCTILQFWFVAPAAAFSDVPSDHPYAAAIDDLFDRQIVNGYVNGSFGPQDSAMRQQFAKMIVLSLDLSVSEDDVCTFRDVVISGPGSLYPDNYIAVAAANFITLGTSPTHFSPDRHITRAQAVTMVVRAFDRLRPGVLASTPAGYRSTWGDFSPDHAAAAAKAESNGLLAGLGGSASHPEGDLTSLDPWSDISRGEIAQLLHNLVDRFFPSEPPPTDPVAIHAPDAALSAAYATCAGSSCHELNLYSQHVVKQGLSCAICHGSSRPEVVAAIHAFTQTGAKQGCRVCHGQDAGQHSMSHRLDNPVPTACTLCHSSDLVTEHVTTHQLGCAACHGPGASAAVALVVASFSGSNPLNPVCTDCHSATHPGAAAAHTASEAAECALCHQTVLPEEHARSSSSASGGGCATCHPLPQTFSWSGLCADCHRTGGAAPVRHQSIEGAHYSPSECGIAGCHVSDLRALHQATALECAICHTPSSIPTSGQCTDCHTSVHPGLAAAHTEAEAAGCTDCHLMVLPDEHARSTGSSSVSGCQNCHPLPSSFTSTKKCADCHRVSGPAPVPHAGIESAHAVSTSCSIAGCHLADLRALHQATPQGCKTCHSPSSVPTSRQCTDCHTSTPHTVREPYRDSCANCHTIGAPGQGLHDEHVNRGFACSECHGDSAPGCAFGSCHEHSVDQIHAVDDHPADCTYCHKSGAHSGTP